MAKFRWIAALLVLLTIVGVAVPAWACFDGDDALPLIDGELPGGG